jgi:hypothetical protein
MNSTEKANEWIKNALIFRILVFSYTEIADPVMNKNATAVQNIICDFFI